MFNPHQVTEDFERAVAAYAGAPYCVAVNSCTMALLLALRWHRIHMGDPSFVTVPKRTYVSVPMSAIHAGFEVVFTDITWLGSYRIWPTQVIDSARHFTSGIYNAGEFRCLSFHAAKTLGIEQGGCILHDNAEADAWLRRMRFDGRTKGLQPRSDDIREIGWHCYMNPSTAAQGLLKLHSLPLHNDPLPNDDYPDLSQMEAFK